VYIGRLFSGGSLEDRHLWYLSLRIKWEFPLYWDRYLWYLSSIIKKKKMNGGLGVRERKLRYN